MGTTDETRKRERKKKEREKKDGEMSKLKGNSVSIIKFKTTGLPSLNSILSAKKTRKDKFRVSESVLCARFGRQSRNDRDLIDWDESMKWFIHVMSDTWCYSNGKVHDGSLRKSVVLWVALKSVNLKSTGWFVDGSSPGKTLSSWMSEQSIN